MRLAKRPVFAYHFGMRPGSIRAVLVLAVAAATLLAHGAGASTHARGKLVAAFRDASRAYRVPVRLLLAVGEVNTRLQMPARPALNGGYGVMDLTPAQLRRASRLARIDPVAARHDLRQNVRAGAALLASLRTSSWYGALARLGGAPFADEVFLRLGRPLPRRAPAASAARADFPGAHWLPASKANYTTANRPLSSRITTVVIHVTDGSYGGTLSWFRNPSARATTHYVVRSSDGDVTQMVREKDIAWHAGNWAVNETSVGIEHEGFTGHCTWFTDAMYRSSAQLAAYLATKYLIPINRKHFIGHNEVPDPSNPRRFGGAGHHTDPGSCWKWARYMALVRDFAGASVGTTLQRIADDSTRAFKAPRGWKRKAATASYGRGYAVSKPSKSRNAARLSFGVPVTGSYALYGWWPASRSRNSSVPVAVDTAAGREWFRVDERKGSVWTYLGTFPLKKGKRTVRFSPRTKTKGSIVADAVKVELLAPNPTSGLEAEAAGWAATGRGLSSTSDGGISWSSISPADLSPEQIRGVRIMGTNGWLVAATGDPTQRLALYRTADAGATWTATPLPARPDVDVAAKATIEVADDTHVFIGLRLEPNRWSLSRGLLLRSSDGGVTWAKTMLPAAGEISFPTAQDGWLVGGLARERLYASHDGGRKWKAVRPKAAISGAASITYALPTFSSETEGVLPVSLAAGARSTLAFETTYDGGRSWYVAAKVRIGKSLRFASSVPSAVIDPDLWLAAVGKRLVAVTDGGLTKTTVGTLPGTVSGLQFASGTIGWAQVPGACAAKTRVCPIKLFATADGGITWVRLRPPGA